MNIAEPYKLTRKLAIKVRDIVDVGLTKGKGDPVAGHLCVEAAVSLAMGLPHSDRPPCVGSAVRTFKIALNDCAWSSDKARAKGMRGLAIAQLGSDTIDQNRFAELLATKCTNKIVPIALRAVAKLQKKIHADNLEACAVDCEAQTTVEGSKKAANAASIAAFAAAANYANAATAAANYAASAASAANAADSAAYAADSADSAAYAAAKDKKEYDRILTVIADCALEVLIELKSPGCKWLLILKMNAKE